MRLSAGNCTSRRIRHSVVAADVEIVHVGVAIGSDVEITYRFRCIQKIPRGRLYSKRIGLAVRADFRRLYPANAKTPTCC